MACNCKKRTEKNMTHNIDSEVVAHAKQMNLTQCYLCAKKHIVAAKILFREYHTGYPNHIKNLINSLKVSEDAVREAFIKWQDIMGEMNMGEAELLGNEEMDSKHIEMANKIRDERIKLSDDPLYVPKFNYLLVEIHKLQMTF